MSPHNNTPDNFRKRMVVLTVFLFLFGAAIVGRLFVLQVVSGKTYRQEAGAVYARKSKLTASRGDIKVNDKLANTPYAVATNIEKQLVFADPRGIKDVKKAAELLAPIIGVEASGLEPKLSDQSKKYVPLKRQLTDEQVDQIGKLQLPGIAFDAETTRFYPEKSFLSQVLGFVGYRGNDRVGLYGLERYYEGDLAGKNGILNEDRDTKGAWIFGSKREFVPAIDGMNLLLTVDKNIQYQAERILKETVETNQADSGCIVVMDPKGGAILAMANHYASDPDYDPNQYNKASDPSVYNNLCTVGNYEPGSVFKPITMASSLNEGKVTPQTKYTDAGFVEIDGYTIKNSDEKAHGQQTMTQVLDESLNTGAIFAKEQIGNETFLSYVKKFGFGKDTGIELPETVGNLDNLKGNIKINYHTASFGQGIAVTPIQLVQAFSALANNGKMVKPYIVQSKIYPDGRSEETHIEKSVEVISAQAASSISGMLVSVVENGHGKRARVPGYYIAGKTGTAQVPKKDGGGYEENNNIGSFIGYGPVEDPKFVMLVRVNHPRTVKFAESTAAPAFGELAQFILNYYNIPPNRK